MKLSPTSEESTLPLPQLTRAQTGLREGKPRRYRGSHRIDPLPGMLDVSTIEASAP